VAALAAEKDELPDGRQRLVATALALFASKGFDSVTVREIAKAAEVSIGLISHHFGSKEGLREAVDEYFMAQFAEVLNIDPQRGAFVQWVDDWIARHEAEAAPLFGYFRRALLDESDWGAKIFERFYAITQQTITRLDAQGRIRPDVDRLWLPFLMIYLELGTTLLDPYVKRILGRSGFEPDLWRRRHRAYLSLLAHGYGPAPTERPDKGKA
jgi:AcrR family transcriptional regulator